MSSQGCSKSNWSWQEQNGVSHYVGNLFDEEDIQGVIMVVLVYGRFPNKQLDFASEEMSGFVGFDLTPIPCLIFDPTSQGLIYNTEDLITQYKTQVQEFIKDADRVEICYVNKNFEKQSLVCGLAPR